MATFIDAAPDAVLALAQARGDSATDTLASRSASATPAEYTSSRTPLVTLAADIGADGNFGERWLVVDHASVRVFDVSADGKPSLALEAAIEDIESACPGHFTGSGDLQLRLRNGASVEALRYTPARARQFGLAARVIEGLAQGERIDKLLETEIPLQKCDKCATPLAPDTKVCPVCLDKRATLMRLAAYSRPYARRVAVMVLGSPW